MKRVEGVVAQTVAEKVKERVFNAVANGDLVAVKEILKKNGDDDVKKMTFQGLSLLDVATRNGRANIVKLLLKSGFDPLQKDAGDASVLQNALQDGNYEMAVILMDKLIAKGGEYFSTLESCLILLSPNEKLVKFVDAVATSKNPVAASVLSELLSVVKALVRLKKIPAGSGVERVPTSKIDEGNYAMQSCILNVCRGRAFEKYSESLKDARSRLENHSGRDLELLKCGDAMISGRDFRDIVDNVAANIYFKVKDCALGLCDISLPGTVVGDQDVRGFSKAVAMNAVALLYDHEVRICEVVQKAKDFLAKNPDAEKAKVFLEDLSQDMNLHFDIGISHLRAGTGGYLKGFMYRDLVFESAIGTLKESQLSSSEDLARRMMLSAFEIKSADVGATRSDEVASELGVKVDLVGAAPAADAATGPGIGVGAAGMADGGHSLLESSAPAGPVISLSDDDVAEDIDSDDDVAEDIDSDDDVIPHLELNDDGIPHLELNDGDIPYLESGDDVIPHLESGDDDIPHLELENGNDGHLAGGGQLRLQFNDDYDFLSLDAAPIPVPELEYPQEGDPLAGGGRGAGSNGRGNEASGPR